ncbi:MAG TPA: imidazole glycerol phosphate synthase subunit HisH [Hyphomicrobiales bacterium]|nr:imidazole glycerol phosphate synthase subunit HisH [Hyphomicrobiales bacterium]
MKIAIIDYGSGNLHSAAKAFERAATEAGSGHKIVVTSNPADVLDAGRIVLPGVGAYGDCWKGLNAIEGMVDALKKSVLDAGKPFLGICVGMQLISERGFEHGVTEGLGWIKGDVKRIEPGDPALKIPHMGWNTLSVVNEHALLDGIPAGPDGWHAYFVHSYALMNGDNAELVAEADYGGRVTAIVARDNIAGTQFHPEKSQKLGLRLIVNFLQWQP